MAARTDFADVGFGHEMGRNFRSLSNIKKSRVTRKFVLLDDSSIILTVREILLFDN